MKPSIEWLGLGVLTCALLGCGRGPSQQIQQISQVTFSPSMLTFADTLVGQSAGTQTITLSSTGNTVLTITSIGVTGMNASDFLLSNSCRTSIASGSMCQISVTFVPTAVGARTAAVSVVDDASGSPQTLALSGTGTVAVISLAPTSLTFPSTNVGSTATLTTTLKNTGTGNLLFNRTIVTGSGAQDFSESDNCGSTVTPGASCMISVTFAPLTAGALAGTISIADNATNTPQTIAVSGTGLAPAVSLSATALMFGATGVGSTSASQTVTITNVGTSSLTNIVVSANGPFMATTCGLTLVVNATCTLTVQLSPPCTGHDTFTPGSPTLYTGMLSITDNAQTSPQTVSLAGTGLSSATANMTPGKILVGVDGHRDKGGNYSSVSVCQQIADIHKVSGTTPYTSLYRAWDSVHDYTAPNDNPTLSIPADIQQFQAAGILPLVGAVIDPPCLPGGATLFTTPNHSYADGYAWAYALTKSDALAAPNNLYWFIGNEWSSMVVHGTDCSNVQHGGTWPASPMVAAQWRDPYQAYYQVYLGALAGAIQALRDTIPGVKILSGVNGGATTIGLTVAMGQNLQSKGLMWDYTNLHWGNGYVFYPTTEHFDDPAEFYGLGSDTQLYDAYTTLNALGAPIFIDEFSSYIGGSAANDTNAAIATVALLTDLLTHAPKTTTEQGIVAANYYELYDIDTTDQVSHLFTVNNGNTAIAPEGSMLASMLNQSPLLNAGAAFSLTGTNFSISSPGYFGTSMITLVPGTGYISGSTVTLTCMVWYANQTSPTLNPTCSFGGKPSATVSATSKTASLTVSTQSGTLPQNYVLSIIGTVPGASTNTTLAFTLY